MVRNCLLKSRRHALQENGKAEPLGSELLIHRKDTNRISDKISHWCLKHTANHTSFDTFSHCSETAAMPINWYHMFKQYFLTFYVLKSGGFFPYFNHRTKAFDGLQYKQWIPHLCCNTKEQIKNVKKIPFTFDTPWITNNYRQFNMILSEEWTVCETWRNENYTCGIER